MARRTKDTAALVVPKVPPQLCITRTQWQAATGLPARTLDALVALRVIPSVHCGRRRLFRVADVQSWIDRLAATGENPDPVRKRAALKAKARAA
jgi:hypothetical protein